MSSVQPRSPRHRSRSAIAAVACVLMLGGVARTHAAEAPVVRIGFGGWYEVGRWTETVIDLPADVPAGSRLLVRAPDPDGNVVTYLGEPAAAPTKSLTALFANGRLDIPLEVEVVENGNTTVGPIRISRAAARVVRQDVRLIATIGNPAGFDDYIGEEPRRSNAPGRANWRVVPLESLDRLPSTARGLEGLDMLVLADGFETDPERLDAIERWVWNGGHLVVATGENQDDYVDGPFASAEWMPAGIGETPLRLAKLDVLQQFAQENAVIPMLRPAVGARLVVDDSAVEVVARVYGDPILVRSVHGFGHVTLLGVELHRPPLSEWTGGVESFVRRLLDVQPEMRKRAAADEDRRLARSGVNDLATQFNAAQDDFDAVNRSSRWTVMGLVLLYILLVGPLDYLFVHRVLRRPEWTWATFPLVAIVATILGLSTAASSNGSTLHVNQFEIVDVDAASGRLRGLEFATVYSPENRRYAITASASTVGGETGNAVPVVNWFGLPEDSYGGMYRQGGLRVGGLAYRENDAADGFANVPIPVWSTQPFRAEWTEDVGPVVTSQLADQGLGRVAGTIESNLGFDLHDWMLVYGSQLYRPKADPNGERPPLVSGKTWHVDTRTVEPRDLRHYLTQTTSERIEGKRDIDDRYVVTESIYDPLDRDPRRLVEMLSFFEIAGGSNYTKLENTLLDRQDLSTLLLRGRAILVGRADQPLGRVKVDGQVVESGRHTTFVRIVLPVRSR